MFEQLALLADLKRRNIIIVEDALKFKKEVSDFKVYNYLSIDLYFLIKYGLSLINYLHIYYKIIAPFLYVLAFLKNTQQNFCTVFIHE